MKIFPNISTEKEALSASSIFKLLKLHKLFITVFVLVALVLTVIYAFIVPVKYEAFASIVPPDDAGAGPGLSSFLQSLSGGLAIGGLADDSKVLLFDDYIKSRQVAKYIVEKLDLSNHRFYETDNFELIYQAITSSIETKLNRSGTIFMWTYATTQYFPNKEDKAEAARLSAEIANTAIEALDFVNREKNVSKARKKRIFIDRMLTQKRFELDSIDGELEKFQKENKILSLDEQTQAILTYAITIGTELQKAEVELALKINEYEPNSPIVKAYQSIVNKLKDQYSRVQRGGLVATDDFSVPLAEVPQLIRIYSNLIRDKKIHEQINLYLETQKYQEAIQEESDVPTVDALDKAVVPFKSYSPNKKALLLLGLFLALFFSISIVIGRAIIKGKFYFEQANPIEAPKIDNIS